VDAHTLKQSHWVRYTAKPAMSWSNHSVDCKALRVVVIIFRIHQKLPFFRAMAFVVPPQDIHVR